jgi:hypothetical protein
MTLVEFLHPIAGKTNKDKCLAVLYYKLRYEHVDSMTAEEIRKALEQSRMPNAKHTNVADVLSKSGALVDSPGSKGQALLWRITEAGKKHIRDLMKLPETDPEVEHDVSELNKLLAGIKDPIVHAFVEESVNCLRIGALKAAIVLLWAGAVRTIQEKTLAKGATLVNTELLKRDSKARTIKKVEDFQYIQEETLLLVAEGVGVLDKTTRGILHTNLQTRNGCGHPNNYNPGPARAKSFIEDVAGIAFR